MKHFSKCKQTNTITAYHSRRPVRFVDEFSQADEITINDKKEIYAWDYDEWNESNFALRVGTADDVNNFFIIDAMIFQYFLIYILLPLW